MKRLPKWSPVGDDLLARYAGEREQRGKRPLKPLKNRLARRYRDLSVKTGQHYTEMARLARRDPKRFLKGGHPMRGISLRGEYMELDE